MTYNNLANEVTSKSGSWTVGVPFSYSPLNLQSGIPHKDQLEVERIFTLPTSASVTPGPVTVNIKDNISTHDLHRIFIVNKDDYTVNETTKDILTLTPSVAPNTRTYTFEKGTLAGKTYTIPTITSGEAIVVRRKTVSNTSYVSWSAGSRLTSQQLNLQVNQLLKLTQELIYKLESEYLRSSDISGSSAPAFTIGNDLDMGVTNKIINLANPTTTFGSDTTSAVNKGFIESHYVNLDQNQAQSINGAKTFTSAAIFQNTLTADSTLTATSTLTVSGLTTLNGGLTMDGGVFTVADASGNTGIGGTLNVTGATVLSSTLSAGATTLASASVTGNTGIGLATAVPNTNVTKALHIHSTDTTNRVAELRLTNATTTSAANTGFAIQEAVNSAYLWNFSAGPISIGTDNTERIVIPSDASGIRFPASPTLSGNVNTLDAYEEGSWTPVFTGLTRTDGIVAGRYTRIGRVIILQMAVLNATFTGTGTGDITGCPAALNPGMRTSSALLWQDSFSNITTNNTVYWFFGTDGAMGFYRNSVSGANWLLTPITAGSGRYLHGTLVYTL